jgi:hypothetical protein
MGHMIQAAKTAETAGAAQPYSVCDDAENSRTGTGYLRAWWRAPTRRSTGGALEILAQPDEQRCPSGAAEVLGFVGAGDVEHLPPEVGDALLAGGLRHERQLRPDLPCPGSAVPSAH